MDHRKFLWRTVAALTMMLGLSAGATAIGGSVAYASSSTSAACTNYVVTSPAVDVWTFPFGDETYTKWAYGRVFCASGKDFSGTRFQTTFNCPEVAGHCEYLGPRTAWVTADPQYVMPANCGFHTPVRPVDVWTFPYGDERWTTWQSGDSFCDFGTNSTADRYQVFVYCGEPFCHWDVGTFIGWVTTDPTYYAAPLGS